VKKGIDLRPICFFQLDGRRSAAQYLSRQPTTGAGAGEHCSPTGACSLILVSRKKGEQMKDRTSLEHLEDDGHTLDHLAAYVMIWYEALRKGGMVPPFDNVPGVMIEMEEVIHQLADRKKRLRDEEQKQTDRRLFFSGY